MQSQDPVKKISRKHTILDSRICCLAPGPNLIYIGTVSGELKVALRSTGEVIRDRSWTQQNTPIEGVMYDYEGKVIYGTEFNLVILDKDFKKKIKEVRSVQPLRNFFKEIFSHDSFNWKENDPDFGP